MLLGRGAIRAAIVVFGCLAGLGGGIAAADETASKHFGGQAFDIADPTKGGRGGQIYLNNCAGCHDSGVGHAPQRVIFTYMSPQSIYHVLTDGPMKTQAQGLSDADKVAVAEFLSGRKMSAASDVHEPPACKGIAAQFDFSQPPVFPSWGLQFNNTRLIPTDLAGIDKTNITNLHLKWAVTFPNSVRVRSQPALAAGAVYIGSHNGGVYALDRETGCARWIFQSDAEVRTGIIVSQWKAGDRTAKPTIYFGDIVGNLYAVDAQTGHLDWRAKADEHPNTVITAAPTLYGDTLYASVSSMEGLRPSDPNFACCTFRGSVVALNAATGEKKWQTYMTAEPKLVGKNAKGAAEYAPSGAPIWNSPAIDVKRQQIYVGTGENYSSPANDKSDAIVALDLHTGAFKWVYQALTHDATNIACLSADTTNCPKENGPDLDFGAAVMLATTANGRQLVIGGQKAGKVFALDPDTGKLVWKAQPGRGGMLGGVHFGMAANRNAVFVPINDANDGQHNGITPHPGIYALDLATGKMLWSQLANPKTCTGIPLCWIGYSQAITATPDLVFAGSVDGWLRVFDARSGALVWQDDTKLPVKTVNGVTANGGSFGGGSAPVLYHGVLYLSSGYGFGGEMPGNVLLAFSAK